MDKSPLRVPAVLAGILFSFLLTSCGGGGDPTTGAGPGTGVASGDTNGGGTPSGPLPSPSPAPTSPDASPEPPPASDGGSPPADAGFSAVLGSAPADGAELASTVRLEVRGSGLQNVELLPAQGFSPRLASFSINRERTLAWLDFDATGLPDGRLRARIVAFSAPAGQGGQSIEVMPARTWSLYFNRPFTGSAVPPASVMPEVWLSYYDLPYVDPQPLHDMLAMDEARYHAMLADEPERVRTILRRYIPAHVVLYPPTPRSFHGEWGACYESLSTQTCPRVMASLAELMNSKRP